MARIVLLGLGNEDVDVLSRLASLDPTPEVLAVHPDPEALILRLAAVASYPALTEPPRPRKDDVVVVPSVRGPLDAQMVRPWRELGVRILLPDAPALSDLVAQPREDVAPVLTGAGVGDREARAAAALAGGREPSSKQPEKTPATDMTAKDSASDAPRGESPEGRPGDAVADAAPASETPAPAPGGRAPEAPPAAMSTAPSAGGPAGPPVSAWDSPEDTFRYLAGEVFGPDRPASLWWNGDVGVWVPWVWTGPVPARGAEAEPAGIEIPSRWGSFRLLPAAGTGPDIPVKAFSRVAEDIALRDLMIWRGESQQFTQLGTPDPGADEAALRRWAEPLLAHLRAQSVLLWRSEGKRFRLVHAAGEGLELSGSLVMPAAMVAASFESKTSGWRRWDPVPGLTMHLAREGSDPRLPLRLRRLELALAGEPTRW